ncbi:hypothetical protein [Methanocella conradii]|uniref:hypothetical protein n=1 Tax=Methanocella conradii TaxID=1175444 RepID=UPI00157D5998|nr:hypothetical protein [Methanocella conradii]
MLNKFKIGVRGMALMVIFLIIIAILTVGTVNEDTVSSQDVVKEKIANDMKNYSWASSIEQDLIIGNIEKPQNAKMYVASENDLMVSSAQKPTPELAPRWYTEETLSPISPQNSLEGISAGYQIFGTPSSSVYSGRIYGRTSSPQSLIDNGKDYMVMHQWGVYNGQTTENCVVATRWGSSVAYSIKIDGAGGYQDWVYYPASDTISIGIRADTDSGQRIYNSVFVWVWDVTTDTFWSKTYTLSRTEEINDVDVALEQPNDYPYPSGNWTCFYNVNAFDQDIHSIPLADHFRWAEHSFPEIMTNQHSEDFNAITFWQRKV